MDSAALHSFSIDTVSDIVTILKKKKKVAKDTSEAAKIVQRLRVLQGRSWTKANDSPVPTSLPLRKYELF